VSVSAIDPRWPTAIHEAGHAVAARAFGRPITSVTIVPDNDRLGLCVTKTLPRWFRPDIECDTRHRLLGESVIMVFWPVEKRRLTRRATHPGVPATTPMPWRWPYG